MIDHVYISVTDIARRRIQVDPTNSETPRR
jgi:hypothetical protein